MGTLTIRNRASQAITWNDISLSIIISLWLNAQIMKLHLAIYSNGLVEINVLNNIYYMACVCSRYNARSDWLI